MFYLKKDCKIYERKRQAAKRVQVRMLLDIYPASTIKILASGSIKHWTIFWFCGIVIVAISLLLQVSSLLGQPQGQVLPLYALALSLLRQLQE